MTMDVILKEALFHLDYKICCPIENYSSNYSLENG